MSLSAHHSNGPAVFNQTKPPSACKIFLRPTIHPAKSCEPDIGHKHPAPSVGRQENNQSYLRILLSINSLGFSTTLLKDWGTLTVLFKLLVLRRPRHRCTNRLHLTCSKARSNLPPSPVWRGTFHLSSNRLRTSISWIMHKASLSMMLCRHVCQKIDKPDLGTSPARHLAPFVLYFPHALSPHSSTTIPNAVPVDATMRNSTRTRRSGVSFPHTPGS